MKELSPYLIRRDGAARPPQQPAYAEPGQEEMPEPGFWDFWRVIIRRRRPIRLFFFSVVIVVGVGTFLMTPMYTSDTILLIEEKGPQIVDIKQVISETIGGTDKHNYYDTQFEILKTWSLAAQVIREQRLADNKIFTGEEKTGIGAALVSSVTRRIKAQPWIRGMLPSRHDADDPDAVLDRLTKIYLEKYLEVEPIKNTRLVRIKFSTPDADLSAQLANAHAQAYIRQGLKFRALANADAEKFLQKKLVELKERVEKSETVLNDYRRNKGIISLNDKENVVVERLADLNKRLTDAEAERITLQAQVQLIRQRAYDSLPAVINNQLIAGLKEQLSRLEGEHANLSAEYNPGYPRLAQVKAQLDETRKRLRTEIQSVVAGIESAYLAAEAREKGLRAKMTEQRNAALQLKDASVEYAILAREVDTNNQLYDSILQRMKEMDVAGEIGSSNVFVVEEAGAALQPSRPRNGLNLLLGFVLGAMGGVALAFVLEYVDKTVSRPDEVERYFHLPTLAVIPDFLEVEKESRAKLLWAGNGSASESIDRNGSAAANGTGQGNGNFRGIALALSRLPPSLVAESYRSLQTSILLSQAEAPPKVLLFTSACREEGKTATAINTAIVFAQMEARVLIIDADLRRPSCHKNLWLERTPGLTELLTGQRTLQQVIKQTLTDNLFVITAGAIPPDPVKLVGSNKMHEVIAELRNHFDHVFIDSPPLTAVSDAVRLSTMTDGVLLVVKGQETTRDALQEACSRLNYAQAKVLGVVLNGVDFKNGYSRYWADYYYTTASPEVS
jgi:capsular exopolysaccharide synthesis family protein